MIPEEDSLYTVFFEVIKLHYHRSRALFEQIGVYPGQPSMLSALNFKEGQSQTELANQLNIKPATVTVMLNRLEKEGLVERSQDLEDLRISRVYLTEKGREVFSEVQKIKQQIEKECFANFTTEEQILLRRLLMQVRNNLKETTSEN